MTVKKYRKKPVMIEAMKWTSGPRGTKALLAWCPDASEIESIKTIAGPGIIIKTLEGNMRANPGDYIIKGVAGEFYPCKSDIFEQTYEEVESEV